ncbi:hypothetical protein D3C87_2132200 [compost metagenome]
MRAGIGYRHVKQLFIGLQVLVTGYDLFYKSHPFIENGLVIKAKKCILVTAEQRLVGMAELAVGNLPKTFDARAVPAEVNA